MKKTIVIFVAAVLLAACSINETPTEDKLPVVGPIQLHPENQHYFLYKGKTLALITSTSIPSLPRVSAALRASVRTDP